MPARGRKCETCDHWEGEDYDPSVKEVKTGKCRRIPFVSASNCVSFPSVYLGYWCGQWTPIPEDQESEGKP